MTEEQFRRLLPNASKSFLAANPLSSPSDDNKTRKPLLVGAAKPKRRGVLNATEREFAMILEAQRRNHEIASFEFEGITLRFAGVAYTPDFIIFPLPLAVSAQIKLIEVKGRFIKGKFERAIERFRHAKTYWPQFIFELHQRTKDGWRQII